MNEPALENSRALWNRTAFDLDSDEVLAQILDRGEMDAWRALYRLASSDSRLRGRIKRILLTVPMPLPRFWLAVLAALGEHVDYDVPLPSYMQHSP